MIDLAERLDEQSYEVMDYNQHVASVGIVINSPFAWK